MASLKSNLSGLKFKLEVSHLFFVFIVLLLNSRSNASDTYSFKRQEALENLKSYDMSLDRLTSTRVCVLIIRSFPFLVLFNLVPPASEKYIFNTKYVPVHKGEGGV